MYMFTFCCRLTETVPTLVLVTQISTDEDRSERSAKVSVRDLTPPFSSHSVMYDDRQITTHEGYTFLPELFERATRIAK